MTKGARITQIIPAEPGYSAGEFLFEGSDRSKAQISDIDEWFEPIIAWAICVELNENGEPTAPQSVMPICVKGDMVGDILIRLPDGQIKPHFDGIPVSHEQAKQQFLTQILNGIR